VVLVVSHGNTLRALIKHLESVSDEASSELNVPNAVPLLYELDTQLRPVGGRRPIYGPSSAGGRSRSAGFRRSPGC
jgi:2,3-bisphosphoglycerate-dependent phosphoglycerate mutase